MSAEVRSLPQLFRENVKKFGNRPCFQFKKEGCWQTLSWNQVEEGVRQISLGLKTLGVKKGDSVAIFSSTRVEWTLCDLAILSLGAVTVPVYQSNTADQVAYILDNSSTQFVFVENDSLFEKVKSELTKLPRLEKIILISGKSTHPKLLALASLQAQGKKDLEGIKNWEKNFEGIDPSETATLVYTSGTTGPPKGVILTHRNFLDEAEACQKLFDISEKETGIIFLPLAHILAREMQFFQIKVGYVQVYAENIDKLVENMGEVRPHFFASVPRIFEKVHERVLQQVESGSPLKKAIFSWAFAIGREISQRKQSHQSVGFLLTLQGKLAFQLVFKKLKQRLGGRLRYAVSGGAPLSKEISEFFHAADILILEGYGLTETTGAINCNTLNHFRFGTVGKPIDGAEEKIAPDGEILVRGSVIFKGYFKDEEATRQVLSPDGWFKTGDIGEIDAEGFLKITDRKKDIIVTAGGKNIAPQNIESMLKTVPFISQVMVHGDKRKYLSALVTLHRDSIESLAQSEGISFTNYPELIQNPKIFSLVKKAIDEKNKSLASFESVKKFAILENDFTQETGELTPTLKVKRKFVTEKYKGVLDQLYQE